MSEEDTTRQTYRAVSWAFVPGVAVRSALVGLVSAPVAVVFVLFALVTVEETGLYARLVGVLEITGFGPVAAVGFFVPVVGSLAIVFVSHGRRRYEFDADGITRVGGLFSTTETVVAFEDVEGATFTQSKIQAMYGAGTIFVDIGGGTRRLRCVEDPESVYTEILRQIADVTGSSGGSSPDVPDSGDFGELSLRSEDISRLSADRAAADTGFRYLMPTAIVHPEPRNAVGIGLIIAFLHSLVGVLVLAFLALALIPLLQLTGWQYLGIVVLGYVVYSALVAAWFYWTYDRTHYEFYRDHLRIVRRGETTSISFEDVDSVKVPGREATANVDTVRLRGKDGSLLDNLEFVEDADAVAEYLQALVDSAKHSR